MDVGPFASIAQIRILLVPVGSIRRSTFEKYAGLVRSFDHIRLGDIPPDAREDKNRFLPSPLASGHLHLSFVTNPPPTWRSPFNLFRVSSFPLGVIGVADCTSGETASSIVAEFKANISILFPDWSPFPFATRCFAFEDGEGNANMNLSASVHDLVAIPSLMANRQVYVGTLLAELCHDILIEFPSIVRCIDTPYGLDTLNSEILPRLGQIGGVYYLYKSSENPAELTRSGGQRSSTPSSNRVANGAVPGSGIPPTKLAVGSSLKKRNSAPGQGGRLAKIIGDLYLISGKLSEANYWFTEAITLFRAAQDAIWNGSALEGQCVIEVLEAWNLGDSLHTSLGGNVLGHPWANISDKLDQASNLYSRAAPTSTSISNATPSDTEISSIVFLFISSVLRHAHLLFCVWSSKGWNPISLSSTFSISLPPTFTPDKPSVSALHRMSALSNITRSSIAQLIAQCHGPFLLHLQPSDRIFAYSVMAKFYSCLDFRRKEVYVLRELQAAVVDLIILGREESRNDFSELTSGYASNIETDRDDLTEPSSHPGSLARRDQENEEGNSSVLRITRYISAVYGIDLEAVKLGIENEMARGSCENADDGQRLFQETSGTVPYGWAELQVGVVREAIAVTEALPDHASKIQISLSTIKQLHQHLVPNEQQHLYDTAVRGLNTVRRRGGLQRPEFWPHNPIISLGVIPLSPHKRPIEQSRKRLKRSSAPVIQRPFIYDPKGKRTSAAHVAIQNETLDFEVNLRNPYLFDLDIQSISLSTTDSEFQAKQLSVVIPADSEISVVISGVPLESGTVTIRGCYLQLLGGASKEILVPLLDDNGVRVSVPGVSNPDNDPDRVKYTGLENNLLISPREEIAYKPKRVSQARVPRFLQVHVIPEQPMLRLQRSSVVHGSLMLFSGERSTVQLTVENISTLPVDFHKLTFEDSTMASAQQALDEGDLSVAEAYETEYELLRRPFLSWDPSDRRRVIAPGAKLTIKVACYGKLDCSFGMVNFSYGYINRHSSDNLSTKGFSSLQDIFHLRQIQYPINVTVFHTLECNNLDIIPLRKFHSLPLLGENAPQEDQARKKLLGEGKPGEYCLISLDISNVFGMPFNATLSRRQADTPEAAMTRVVPPGSTIRLFLPIKRFLLSSEDCSAPMPNLSDRQFVVSKEKLSQEEEKLQRELFWYREELFKIVDATWTEDATHRSGIISLRSQRLTLSMCEAMRQACFFIEPRFETVCTEGERVEAGSNLSQGALFTRLLASRDRNTWRVGVCEMMYLVTHVRNDLDRTCRLSLTCRPMHPTPIEYAVFDGSLSNNHLGVLQPGQSMTKTFTVVFVAEGTFSFCLDVEELNLESGSLLRSLGRYPATSSESVTAIVEEGR